jgi:hypothetical protein
LEVGIYDAQMAKIMDKAAAELRRLDAENARMRSELERPMSSEATVLVHDNARLRAEVQALRGAVPAGSRIHTLVSSCEDCPACVYESDSRYSCERAGYRKFEQRGATHATPDWCPLPLAAAPQPAQGEKQ